MTEPSTPLMRQYSSIKKEHPSALLFFRLGDFYEMFFDDAVVAAKELQITLTSRNKEKGMAIPMCGVPYHAAEGYISKLIRRGYKVAICDQVEDPRLAKTLVRREVTRVVTPGTANSSLDSEENNFLAAVVSLAAPPASHGINQERGETKQARAGFAALDLSTGEFRATEFSGEGAERRIQDELEQMRPKEVLYASSAPLFDKSAVSWAGETRVPARPLPDSRAWTLRPSLDALEINQRLDAVEQQVKQTIAREELRRALAGVLDLERLLSRVTLETANPRDLVALGASLARIPVVRSALAPLSSERLQSLHVAMDELNDVRTRIEQTIIPEPPISLNEGGVVQPGADCELDELRELSRNGKQFLAQMEQRERERTGISSLKVRFNSVFGYYLEISKANLQLVPPDYERRQTLVNAERFSTPELKQYEAKILDAQEKIVEIERRMFAQLRTLIAGEARRIRQTALALAEVDVLAAFSHLASLRNYCRPEFDNSSDIEIVAGRHPVIEQQDFSPPDFAGHDFSVYDSSKNARFVPNDLFLNSTTHRILLLTGPNMGGKSTYLRQTALIVIMAQMGCFDPASNARLG